MDMVGEWRLDFQRALIPGDHLHSCVKRGERSYFVSSGKNGHPDWARDRGGRSGTPVE